MGISGRRQSQWKAATYLIFVLWALGLDLGRLEVTLTLLTQSQAKLASVVAPLVYAQPTVRA